MWRGLAAHFYWSYIADAANAWRRVNPAGLLGAFAEKVGLSLKRKGASDVDVPKIHGWFAIAHPFRKNLTGTCPTTEYQWN